MDSAKDNRDREQLDRAADKRRLAEIEENTSVISGLSAMERRWLIRYLFHGNATKAAEEAGYKNPNKMGPRLRWRPKIVAAIDEYFYKHEMPAAEVVARLSQQARAEYAAYIGADGLIDLAAMKRDKRLHLVKGIKWTRDGRMIVEFYDAYQALVDIGRYYGLFKDNLKLDIDLSSLSDEELNDLDSSL